MLSIIEGQVAVPKSGGRPELPPEPLLAPPCKSASKDFSELAFRGDTPICATVAQTSEPSDVPYGGAGCFDIATPSDTGSADRCFTATNYPDQIGVVATNYLGMNGLDTARTLHLRRELTEAAEHGAALLAALGLPRLVTADFEPIDREAVADALDVVISHLDAPDAPDEDREPWLAGVIDLVSVDGAPALDAEGDSEEDEGTALERHGRGFVRAGEDDAEDDDGAGDEDSGIGDEDGMAEQLAGWSHCPALAFSNGGYVG